MSENSGQSSVASSPGDIQTDAESQPQPEEEVNKQRRQCDLIERRATLEAQACSNFLNANQIVKDSRRSEFSNDRNALKNVEALSERTISPASLLKGVKKRCIHDDKRQGTCSGTQHRKYNNVKRFKNRDPAEAMEERVKTHGMEITGISLCVKSHLCSQSEFLNLGTSLFVDQPPY